MGFDLLRSSARLAGKMGKRWVQDLCEDRDHNLWIATDDAGLIRLQGRTTTYVGRAEGLPSEHVRVYWWIVAANCSRGTGREGAGTFSAR